MNKTYTLLTLLILLCTHPLHALQVHSPAPGQLHTLIADNPADVTTLTVTGTIDAADLGYISSSLTSLTTLHLADATIAPYTGAPLPYSGRTSSPAHILPEYSLAGTPLTTLTLPRTLRALADAALAATPLTAIDIPTGVDSLGAALFDGCRHLATVTLPTSLTHIPPLAFKGCTALTTITLPAGVTTISAQAFSGCTSLASVTMPRALRTIGPDAFIHCTSLTDIDLTPCTHLTHISHWAFAHCTALATVRLPDTLTTLGSGVLFGCTSLTTITLPADLADLGTCAMAHLTSLTDIDATALTDIPELGTAVFHTTAGPHATLIAPDGLAPAFRATPQWQEFNIIAASIAGNTITLDPADTRTVRLHLDGNTLHIHSQAPLAAIHLHTLLGATTSQSWQTTPDSSTPNSQFSILNYQISVPDTPAPLILTLIYTDGTRTALKLLPSQF